MITPVTYLINVSFWRIEHLYIGASLHAQVKHL